MFEPQDHPDDFAYPGGAADAAVRQRRLDARVPDGREVRSRARRLRRSVRARSTAAPPRAGRGASTAPGAAGYLRQPSPERRVRRRQPPAAAGDGASTGCAIARAGGASGRHRARSTSRPTPATRRRAREGGRGARAGLHRCADARRRGEALRAAAGAHRTLGSLRRVECERLDPLAARALRVSVRGRLSARRSTPAIWRAASTCIILPAEAVPAAEGGGDGAAVPRRARGVSRVASAPITWSAPCRD